MARKVNIFSPRNAAIRNTPHALAFWLASAFFLSGCVTDQERPPMPIQASPDLVPAEATPEKALLDETVTARSTSPAIPSLGKPVTLRWSWNVREFVIESKTNLADPYTVAAIVPVQLEVTNYSCIITADVVRGFFRVGVR